MLKRPDLFLHYNNTNKISLHDEDFFSDISSA